MMFLAKTRILADDEDPLPHDLMADVALSTWRGRCVVRIILVPPHTSFGKKSESPNLGGVKAGAGRSRKGPEPSIKGLRWRIMAGPMRDRKVPAGTGEADGTLGLSIYLEPHTEIQNDVDTQEETFRDRHVLSSATPLSVFSTVPEALRMLIGDDNRFADAFARNDSVEQRESGESQRCDSEGGEDGDDRGVRMVAMTRVLCVIMFIRHDAEEEIAKGHNSRERLSSDMTLGNLLPPWHQSLTQKNKLGPMFAGISMGNGLHIELTPSLFPATFRWDRFLQDMSLAKLSELLLVVSSALNVRL
ncbi:hypothetical protein Tco_1078827 [Tanacetum coccineum]|uniref:Uncharacterized protein n=1 Tax=Tanacetum coccineum TaxID=301880 RepID=A0ABQ5HRR6_9ASTR